MNTIKAAAAAVTGARHVRCGRNGQDAAAAWSSGELAAVVVCDGCSSGASSEVGARLGALLAIRMLAARLAAGERNWPALFAALRADLVRAFAELLERIPGDRAAAIHDQMLFTIVAAAATREDAAVWVLGDGAYTCGGAPRVLGPFEDNQPPYLAYDLLGDPQPAHLEIARDWDAIVIATDGATELPGDEDGIARFARAQFVDHPDALRRELAVLTRADDRIDWDERRVVRTPAAIQDDCAVGVLWSAR